MKFQKIRQNRLTFLLSILLSFGASSFWSSIAKADGPIFKLDQDFTYFSEDEQSLRNLKFYPSKKQKFEKVFLNLRKGLETPAEGLILMHLAFALKEVEEFEKLAKFVLKKDSRLQEARILLAMAAITKNQPYLAKAHIARVNDKSLSSSLKNIKGLIAFQLKKGDQAVRIFKQALKKDSKNYALSMNLGLIYMEFQMYKVAEKHFDKMLKNHKNGHDAKLHLAMALGSQGTQKKLAKARRLVEELGSLFPSSPIIKRTAEMLNKGK